MISMTKYWEQYQECIDSLQVSTQDTEYSRLIATAKDLIKMGLTIEELGITEIKGITNTLNEKSKQFGPEVTYKADEEYTFHLPRIGTTESLIFAILYYQHLSNYQNVSYQGPIYWFRQKVIDGIEEKKISMSHKAKAMLDAIHQYCQNHDITIDETLLLRTKNESGKEYSQRIAMMVRKPQVPSNSVVATQETAVSPMVHQDSSSLLVKRLSLSVENPKSAIVVEVPSQFDRIATLEHSLKQLNNKWLALKTKADVLSQKLLAFDQAKQNHLILTNEWQNQSFIVRAFYWFISFFVEVTAFKNIKNAEEQLVQAENELNQLVPQYTPDSYGAKLKQQQKELKSELVSIQGELKLLKDSQQAQQKEKERRAAELEALNSAPKIEPQLMVKQESTVPHIEPSAETNPTLPPVDKLSTLSHEEEIPTVSDSLSEEETSSNDETADIGYYAFFKSYLPDRKIIGAAALTAAAAVAYNYF